MRLALRGANPVEWLSPRAGVVPTAAAEAWGGMGLSAILIAAVRTGMTTRLAQQPSTAADLAADLGLDPVPTRLLLDCLRSGGHVTVRAGRYQLSRSSRRWLDPESGLSVAQYVAGTSDYWAWWSGLDEVTRNGQPARHHDAPPSDPYWRRYICGQLELARLSADEVARKLRLPGDPRSLLDIGGGHRPEPAPPGPPAAGPGRAGSPAKGREIIAEAGMADRIEHRDGDATTDDLGSGYDAVL